MQTGKNGENMFLSKTARTRKIVKSIQASHFFCLILPFLMLFASFCQVPVFAQSNPEKIVQKVLEEPGVR